LRHGPSFERNESPSDHAFFLAPRIKIDFSYPLYMDNATEETRKYWYSLTDEAISRLGDGKKSPTTHH